MRLQPLGVAVLWVYVVYFTTVLRLNQVMTSSALQHQNERIAQAMLEFNALIALLGGAACMKAADEGDATSVIDPESFASTWEGCSSFRDQMLMCLARSQRDLWRKDVADIVENQQAEHQSLAVAESLTLRLRCALDLGFRFLSPRQMCFLADALMLAFTADMPVSEATLAINKAAQLSRLATTPMLDAMAHGISGMYRYTPHRVLALRRS